MTAEDTLNKLHTDLLRQRREIEYDLKRISEAYGEKMVEYRKVSHGIIGIEDELKKGSGLNDEATINE
jgi:uncharacterized protein